MLKSRNYHIVRHMVNALEIWGELCQPLGNITPNAQDILERGATDFDIPYDPNDSTEPKNYKVNLYTLQYMGMHIKQNIKVFKKYLKPWLKDNQGEIIFIDLGCGPMTSGLALAEVMSKQINYSDYKNNVTYLGIDISQNMVERALSINDEYQIFNADRFQVIRTDKFEANQLPKSTNFDIAILNMSFVLAPNTNKVENQSEWIEDLAHAWNQFATTLPNLQETRAIYMNPNNSSLHFYWDKFQQSLKEYNNINNFAYTSIGRETVKIPNLPNSVVASQIVGKRQ